MTDAEIVELEAASRIFMVITIKYQQNDNINLCTSFVNFVKNPGFSDRDTCRTTTKC